MAKPQLNLDELTDDEKLDIMEEIFADFQRRAVVDSSPPWHADLLAERQRLVDSGETDFVDFDSAMNDLLVESFPR